MDKSKKQLKRLSDKQLFEDVKKYIKSSHSFYETKVPELKVLANRLHEEHSLEDFYKIFDKLWNSVHSRETSLGIYTLQLYKDDFDLKTWKFLKFKLKEIRSSDKIDGIGPSVVGEIIIKYPRLEKEILNFSRGKNIWLKRLSIVSMAPLIKKNDFRLAFKIIEINLHDKSEFMQKAVGLVLNEIGKQKPEVLRKFILKNTNMPPVTFFHATENLKELRRLRELKKPAYNNIERFLFWKN